MRPRLIDIQSELDQGRKWSICPEGGEFSSKNLEFGHVLLQQPDPTDVPHYHQETEEYYLVLEGKMEIQVGTEIFTINPFELLIIPPGVENTHIIKAVSPETLIILFKTPSNPGDKHEHPLP